MAEIKYLFLPSAVEPSKETPFQALTDPDIRFAQTIRALKKWSKTLSKTNILLILADNTGWAQRIEETSISMFGEDKLLVLDLPTPANDLIIRGKGAAEASTLMQMLELVNPEDDDLIAKVNARYFCKNWEILNQRISQTVDFAAWPNASLNGVDTRYFVAKSKHLKAILPSIAHETNDQEGLISELLFGSKSIFVQNVVFERFDFGPAIVGQSGTAGATVSFLSEARIVSFVVLLRLRLYTNFKKFKFRKLISFHK